MLTLSGAPSTSWHTDILHLSISLFGKSSKVMHKDVLTHEYL